MFRTISLVVPLVVLAFVLSLYIDQPRSNIIVISVDSLRADHMSLYGYERSTTPNTDQWAQGAYVFTNYFASSYLTPISEGSVQTGKHPFSSGIINFESTANANTTFLAEILKLEGYRTAAFGSSPEFEVNPALKESFSRGFDVYEPLPTQQSTTTKPQGVQQKVSRRNSTTPVSRALSWISENRTGPFYLWLPLGGVHMPYFDSAPKVFADPAYSGVLSSVRTDEFNTLYGRIYNNTLYPKSTESTGVRTLSEPDIQYIRDRYDDGILETDTMLKEVYDYLRKTGLDQNTIVIFESEHGEGLHERGYIAHYDVYDEGIRTPLIMKVPHQRGRVVSALASSVDIVPTVLSLLSLATTPTDGVSFAPYMMSATTSEPHTSALSIRTPLWERVAEDAAFIAVDNTAHFYDVAVRSKEWKLIHRTARTAEYQYGWWGKLTGNPVLRPEYELYDVIADPEESHNVYDEHQNDDAVQSLKLKLAAYERSISEQKVTPTTNPVQPYF